MPRPTINPTLLWVYTKVNRSNPDRVVLLFQFSTLDAAEIARFIADNPTQTVVVKNTSGRTLEAGV